MDWHEIMLYVILIVGIIFLALGIWYFILLPGGCGGHYYWDAVNQTCRWTGVG